MKKTHALEKQRGQASFVVLVFFMVGLAAITAIGTTQHTANAGRTQMLTRQVESHLGELSKWYESTGIATLGNSTPTEAQLQAIVTQRAVSLRMAMSTPIVRSGCTTVMDCEPTRQILVWYPATSPQEPSALVNGLPLYETGGDAIWRLYDSKVFTQSSMSQATNRLRSIGRSLSDWAAVMRKTDIYSETNYLRAANCSEPGRSLPCMTGFTDITTVAQAMTATGMGQFDVVSPWGSVVEISNAAPHDSAKDPYTLGLRLRTPSGAFLSDTISQ